MNFCRYMHVNLTCFGPSAKAFSESNKKENLKQVAWKCVSLLVRMAASSAMTCWCKGWWGMGGECEQNFSLSIPNQAPTTRYYLQGLSSHSVGGWRQFLCDKGHDCPGKCGAWLHSVMPHKSISGLNAVWACFISVWLIPQTLYCVQYAEALKCASKPFL